MNKGGFKSTTSMLDLFLLMAVGFVSLFVLAFILIQPPVDPAKDVELDEQLLIKLQWDGEHNTDIDLWLMTPDGTLISFKKKNSNSVALERDDTGWNGETVIVDGKSKVVFDNTEVIRIKQLEDGDYYVTVHYYSARSCKQICIEEPFTVTVHDGQRHKDLAIFTGKVIEYGEVSILRITVKDGKIVSYGKHDKILALNNRSASNGRL